MKRKHHSEDGSTTSRHVPAIRKDIASKNIERREHTSAGQDMDEELDLNAEWDETTVKAPPAKTEPSKPWHVMMDFDGTITRTDTIEALVAQTIMYNYATTTEGGGRLLELSELKYTKQGTEWERIKGCYTGDLKIFTQAQQRLFEMEELPRQRAVGRPSEYMKPLQYGYINTFQDEIEMMELLKPIEKLSLDRVNDAGLFEHVGGPSAILKRLAMHSDRNLTPTEIAEADQYPEYGVQIRRGFADFTKELDSRTGAAWGVISVNWSRDWIHGIILKAIGDEEDRDIPILSNNPTAKDEVANGQRPGIAGPNPPVNSYADSPSPILTADDKLNAIICMLGKLQEKSVIKGARPQNMYIGDSKTDLSCLLRAEVGIIMCPELADEPRDSNSSLNHPSPTTSESSPTEAPSPTSPLPSTRPASPIPSSRHTSPFPQSQPRHTTSASPLPYSPGATPTPDLSDAEVPFQPDHELVRILHECNFVTRHVNDHEMLYRRISDDEHSPYVNLLWARDFQEILDSGMLSNGNWKPDTMRRSMASSGNPRNVMRLT